MTPYFHHVVKVIVRHRLSINTVITLNKSCRFVIILADMLRLCNIDIEKIPCYHMLFLIFLLMVPGKAQKNMSALKVLQSTCAYNTCIHLEVGKHGKMKYNIQRR